MSFRVMIVDDDAMMREALRNLVDWKAHGFELVAEAVNGRHALPMVEEKQPQIILTDMSMPEMNGLDLIRNVTERHTEIRCVMLSNYDDFRFVREAMRMGVEDYLLKIDLDADGLLKTLNAVADGIREAQAREREIRVLRSTTGSLPDILMRRLMREGPSPELLAEAELAHIQLPVKNMGLVLVTLEESGNGDGSNDPENVRSQLEAACEDIPGACIFWDGIRIWGVLFSPEYEKSLARFQSMVFEMGERCRRLLIRSTEGRPTVMISSLIPGQAEIPEAYRQCSRTLLMGAFAEPGKILEQSTLHQEAQGRSEAMYALLRHMSQSLENGPGEEVRRVAGEIILTLLEQQLPFQEFRNRVERAETLLTAVLKNLELEVAFADQASQAYQQATCLSGVRDVFLRNMELLYDRLHHETHTFKREVQRAVDYIRKHFSEDIGLDEVAAALSISPSYLSTLFRQETGMRLTEYLTSVRIQEAQKLLAEGKLKVYEVSERTGFNNTTYFCKVFKKLTGLTVNEYRQQS